MNNSSLANIIHTIVSRAVAVLHEVLAFAANLFHVLRGDVVTHVITPAEHVAKQVIADVKEVVTQAETKL